MAGYRGRQGRKSGEPGIDFLEFDGGPRLPAGASAAVAKKWRLLIDQLPARSLRRIDGHQLRLLSEHLTAFDILTEHLETNKGDYPTHRSTLQIVDRIARLSALFGLSPADRARLRHHEANGPDELDRWRAGE